MRESSFSFAYLQRHRAIINQPTCGAFADPYVEHDTLTLLIDLILLKRDVYRHLLFNRGLGARKAGNADGEAESKASKAEAEARREKVRGIYRVRVLRLIGSSGSLVPHS